MPPRSRRPCRNRSAAPRPGRPRGSRTTPSEDDDISFLPPPKGAEPDHRETLEATVAAADLAEMLSIDLPDPRATGILLAAEEDAQGMRLAGSRTELAALVQDLAWQASHCRKRALGIRLQGVCQRVRMAVASARVKPVDERRDPPKVAIDGRWLHEVPIQQTVSTHGHSRRVSTHFCPAFRIQVRRVESCLVLSVPAWLALRLCYEGLLAPTRQLQLQVEGEMAGAYRVEDLRFPDDPGAVGAPVRFCLRPVAQPVRRRGPGGPGRGTGVAPGARSCGPRRRSPARPRR